MLKKPITYKNFDGEEVTEDFYFNLSAAEMVELELGTTGKSFSETLKAVVASKDVGELIKQFKWLILESYGVKSEDGKRFIKNEQVREEFTQTAAYSALFMQLAQDEGEAVKFVNGVLPGDLQEIAKVQDKPTSVPPQFRKDN